MNMKTSAWVFNKNDWQLIELALSEDLGSPYLDLTTSLLFTKRESISTAKIISKHDHPLVIAGLPFVKALLDKIDKSIFLQTDYQDGECLSPGDILLTLKGYTHSLLMLERILLNFLQHLCAVATMTQSFVKKIQHTKAKVLDTRKTLPGFRHLDKYAVFCGGGVNHRFGLYDAVMVKDTHIDFLGGIENTLLKLPSDIKEKFPVIVEVRNISELDIALKYHTKITRVLLDNMTENLISHCVHLTKNKFPLEVSGNINLNNIANVAETGVDFISIGKITHSAGSVDLSMKCE